MIPTIATQPYISTAVSILWRKQVKEPHLPVIKTEKNKINSQLATPTTRLCRVYPEQKYSCFIL